MSYKGGWQLVLQVNIFITKGPPRDLLWDQEEKNGGERVQRGLTRKRGSQDYSRTKIPVPRRNGLWILQMLVGPRVSCRGRVRLGATVLLEQPRWSKDAHTLKECDTRTSVVQKGSQGESLRASLLSAKLSPWPYYLVHTVFIDNESKRDTDHLFMGSRGEGFYLCYPSSLLRHQSSRCQGETASLHSKPLETSVNKGSKGNFKITYKI